ncbi:translation initiation factor IF-2-like [Physeter macrocephalus]|uniref:Translation initiation factor IF-2-like n=1 Tax=Physeter macrocephalus TaxID=9755 RepID=A0A9W2WIZ2_PHYMC|nr:translation initiation factor IF-2-like [Physeter catodon]
MGVLLGSRAASLAPLTHSSIANLSPPAGPPTSPSPGPAAARCLPLRSSSPPRRGALPGPGGPGEARRGPGPPLGRRAAAAGAALPGARRTLLPAPPPRAGPSPRGPRSRPRGSVPAPSVVPGRCSPPAREGGRWVSAEKVNEGGGGVCERLTRGARAPPAPPARRLHGRAARLGGQAPDRARVSGKGVFPQAACCVGAGLGARKHMKSQQPSRR